jgi:hypothetical protein
LKNTAGVVGALDGERVQAEGVGDGLYVAASAGPD